MSTFTNADKQLAHVRQIVKEVFGDMIMRPDWGAKHRNGYGDRSSYYPLARTFLHHTVTQQLSKAVTVGVESQAIRTIEQIGQNRFGVGMSYNSLQPPSGRIYQGTGFSRISAHTGGFNTEGFGHALVGNNDVHNVTDEQIEGAAKFAVACWAEGIWAQPAFTNCHRDVFATSCPGRHGCASRQRINARASDLIRSGGAKPSKPAASKPAKPAPATTPWPRQPLSNPFGRTNPFTRAGARGRNPRDNWREIVPASVRLALRLALQGAGYKPGADTKWGTESQIRDWLYNHNGLRQFTQLAAVQSVARSAGGNGFGNPASIWAAFQAYLASPRGGRRYRGAIDGHPGAQTWWAITDWLNSIRGSYK